MSHVARRRRTLGATLAVLALTSTSAAVAADDPTIPADDPAATADQPANQSAATFTLVTGDRVTAQVSADGALSAPRLSGPGGPDDATDALWTTWTDGGDTYVIPEGAQQLVDAGTLDVELFNLSRLWRSGYDDASTGTLPVIVERSGGSAARATVRGAQVTADLEMIGAQGLAIDKDRAGTVWAQLTGGGTARSAGGVEKVWLDRVVEGTAVTDLPSPTVPLTGAGSAHRRGFDGTGVTVAVLDTGYDLAHPDLAGRVVASQSFVGGAVQDGNGHGTHTLSTVGGSGAASGGRYAGVAPGADLLVGKVLADDGSGQTSGILDGMEWAVEQGADVVSMSLGDPSATSCVGPDVEMIEALADEALFVVAAGNEGLRAQVSTPGCTPSALTVGAVDRHDETAAFSSRGPVVGGVAAKPDIASQGVDVVAARSGGAPGFPYVTMSGTSMATPHVAGAAALVVQAHPEWTPQQVKAALTSAAAPTKAAVLDQGAGPLDVGRAVSEPVTGAPNEELAASDGAGTEGADRFTDTVTLTNTTAKPVRLGLDVDAFGDDGDRLAGVARIDLRGKDEVVVPAHGTVDVPVALDLRRVRDADDLGTVTGRVVGTSRDGARVTVPFWTAVEAPTAQVTVVTKNRFGEAPDTFSSFQVLDDHRDTGARYGVGAGSVTLTLPYGSYDLAAQILTRDTPGNHGQVASVSQVWADDVEVDGDMTVVLDAREARELSWRTDQPSEAQGFSLGYSYGLGDDGAVMTGVLTTIPAYVKHLYTTPAKVGDRFTFVATARAFAPRLALTSSGGYQVDDLAVALAPELDGRGSAPLVDVGPGTDANLAAADVEGKVVLLDGASAVGGGNPLGWSRALRGRGAVAVVAYASGSQGRPYLSSSGVELPMITVTAADAAALQAELAGGDVTMTWDAHAVATSPYVYNLATVEPGRMPSGVQRVRDRDLAEVATGYHTQGVDERQWYLDLALTLPGATPVYASGSLLPVRAPLQRTELYTASPDVRWTTIARMTTNLASAASFDGPRTYSRGASESTSWFATPLGLSGNTNGKALVSRDVDGLSLYLGTWGDAAGHDSIGLANADSVLRTVWVDGERSIPVLGRYAVPAGPSEVHVQQAFTRRTSLYTLGSASTTDWWFTTASADQGAQHTLVPVVDVDAGLTDRVAAGQDVTVRLAADDDATGRPADLAGATLEYSYGAQTLVGQVTDWAEAPVTRDRRGTWSASVPGAGDAGAYLHLRVTMRDGDGNRVEQSMVRVAAVVGATGTPGTAAPTP